MAVFVVVLVVASMAEQRRTRFSLEVMAHRSVAWRGVAWHGDRVASSYGTPPVHRVGITAIYKYITRIMRTLLFMRFVAVRPLAQTGGF